MALEEDPDIGSGGRGGDGDRDRFYDTILADTAEKRADPADRCYLYRR
jgi:hypothetical protein